jgi:hypothetical protein
LEPLRTVDQKHSDYIVYVDESGDHSITSIDENYPIFVLSFCVFLKENYAQVVTPALRMLKFSTFGHDMVILHETDSRKKLGSFKMLGKEEREAFLDKLHLLVAETNFTLIATVINKHKIIEQPLQLMHIYHLAMQIGLEKLYSFLQTQGQADRLTHVICEARGRKEDSDLKLEFCRVCAGHNSLQKTLPFEIVIADKKSNSEGLQFADMVARPIGLSTFRPHQSNRAMKILEKKLHKNADGLALGYGLHLHP